MIEFIGGIIRESIPDLLKIFGASIKWLFYLGQKSFSKIMEEEWNTRLGFFFVLSIILLLAK